MDSYRPLNHKSSSFTRDQTHEFDRYLSWRNAKGNSVHSQLSSILKQPTIQSGFSDDINQELATRRIPSNFKKRGNRWIACALNEGKSFVNPVPKSLRVMGITTAESPSGFNRKFVVETLWGSERCSPSTIDQVNRDLPRTFPDVDHFRRKDIRESLGRLLCVVALEYPSIGYVQGMNFICGNILLHMNGSEDWAFWLFRLMMEHPRYRLEQVFRPGLENLRKLSAALKHLLSKRHPKLQKHFEKIGMDSLIYSQNWIMTLFSYQVPFEPLADIWDTFFEEGWPAIFKIALTLLESSKRRLLSADFETSAKLLRKSAEDISSKTLEQAKQVTLHSRELEMLKRALGDTKNRIVEEEPRECFSMWQENSFDPDSPNPRRVSLASSDTLLTIGTYQPSSPDSKQSAKSVNQSIDLKYDKAENSLSRPSDSKSLYPAIPPPRTGSIKQNRFI